MYNKLIIPNDIQAEQAVLGAILQDNNQINLVSGILKTSSFFNVANQYVFGAMLEIADKNQPIDPVLLGDQLRSSNHLEDVGGYVYLAELEDLAPSSGNIANYAKIIQEHSLLRDLISITAEISKKSSNPENNISELLADAENQIKQISLRTNQKKYSFIKNILVKNFERLEKVSANKKEITGIETGLIDLDRKTSGLQDSDFIVIGARPSMGKTALAMNIASNIAIKKKVKGTVLIFSLEMSEEQLVSRMLSSESKINSTKLKNGNLDQEDWDELARATERISSAKICINDSSNLTSQEVTSIATQLHNEEEGGVSLVIVDYLQLMKGNKPNMPREQEISEISRSLKGLAKDLDIPVIGLSQLNRSVENRSDKHPQLSDLRESGAIEQDADIIVFIYRDEVYNEDSPDRGTAEIIIAKHRNGPTGMLRLSWIGKNSKFDNFTIQDKEL